MIDVLFGIVVFILAVLTLIVITQRLTPGRNDRESHDASSGYDAQDSSTTDTSPASDSGSSGSSD